MQRRDLLKLGSLAAVGIGTDALLAHSPWQRLANTLERGRPADAATVTLLEDRTAEFFRVEETQPARLLLPSLAEHLRTLQMLVRSTPDNDQRRRLLTATGETEALAGWLLFDLNRSRDAIARWRLALDLAKDSGDGPLTACTGWPTRY